MALEFLIHWMQALMQISQVLTSVFLSLLFVTLLFFIVETSYSKLHRFKVPLDRESAQLFVKQKQSVPFYSSLLANLGGTAIVIGQILLIAEVILRAQQ